MDKDKTYIGASPIDWHIADSLSVSTSSYAGELQAALRGFDTPRP